MKYYIRQIIKMIMQHMVFPMYYLWSCRKPIRKKTVLFSDEHKEKCPGSMLLLRERLLASGYQVTDYFFDLKALPAKDGMWKMLAFMRLYAQTEFVVIQDNFLPVSSCRKRNGTKVIQLWHGCGAFKKFGYDTSDDIPHFYKGNVYKNYDLITVSSPYCRPFFASAMRVKDPKCVRATGCSYTDCYYDETYREQMIRKFEDCYGKKNGRNVIVWAPTFRGKAGEPGMDKNNRPIGESWIDRLADNKNYLVIKSMHPHMLKAGEVPALTTGELLFAADVLITDYSSVFFEYLLLNRPVIFFAPDLLRYKDKRGWYLAYEDLPGSIVTEGKSLGEQVMRILEEDQYAEKREKFRRQYMCSCDGNATTRIMDYITEETNIQKC